MKQERMIELREKGETLQKIAIAAGVSVGTVFARTGGRHGPERSPYSKREKSNVERDAEIRQLISEGYNLSEAGRLHGLSRERVRQIVNTLV